MPRRNFMVEILAKDKRVEGWIFKESVYYIVMRFKNNGRVVEQDVSVQDYYSVEVGREYPVTMYSNNGHTWFFSAEEAGVFG